MESAIQLQVQIDILKSQIKALIDMSAAGAEVINLHTGALEIAQNTATSIIDGQQSQRDAVQHLSSATRKLAELHLASTLFFYNLLNGLGAIMINAKIAKSDDLIYLVDQIASSLTPEMREACFQWIDGIKSSWNEHKK